MEEFNRKLSIEILEKAFHALGASFLREHKKYQKEGKLPNKGWKFYESMLLLKNEPKTSEEFYIYGATDKVCCRKIAAAFSSVWMKNAARGPRILNSKYCLNVWKNLFLYSFRPDIIIIIINNHMIIFIKSQSCT